MFMFRFCSYIVVSARLLFMFCFICLVICCLFDPLPFLLMYVCFVFLFLLFVSLLVSFVFLLCVYCMVSFPIIFMCSVSFRIFVGFCPFLFIDVCLLSFRCWFRFVLLFCSLVVPSPCFFRFFFMVIDGMCAT